MFHGIKKGDVLLLAGFLTAALLIALSPLLRNSLRSSEREPKGEVLEIRVSGEVFGTYDLQKDQTIDVQTDYGTNTLIIQSGSVRMESADCKNQICVKSSAIRIPGQMIVCLPHRLSAEIRSATQVSSSGGSTEPSGSSSAVTDSSDSAASYDAIVR